MTKVTTTAKILELWRDAQGRHPDDSRWHHHFFKESARMAEMLEHSMKFVRLYSDSIMTPAIERICAIELIEDFERFQNQEGKGG